MTTDAAISQRPQTSADAIEAELIGSDECRACGLIVRNDSPVLATCRALVDAGYDPSQPLHCYRGETLALEVRSIGEGARLRVANGCNGRPGFVTAGRYSNSPASAPE